MPNQNFYIKTTKKGKDPYLFIKEIEKNIYFEMQDRLVDIGEITAKRMREIIQDSIKRIGSTGRLENSIKSEILDDTAGIHIGIGRISELPPYWEVINDGGYVPVPNRGFFASGLGQSGEGVPPMPGVSGEQWIHTGAKGDYYMNPQKPIDPVGYVEISNAEMNMHIKIAINEFMKTITQ